MFRGLPHVHAKKQIPGSSCTWRTLTEGFNKISIRTVDTDAVVLAVAAAQRHGNTEIWIAFGTGKSFRFLAAHEMARVLGPDRCTALPMFHAFTGCDTVSFFGGRGKRTAWDTWRSYNDITSIFVSLANTPELVESSVTSLERFVILLYDRTSSLEDINQARKHLFAQKGRSIENIPLTKAALVQHIKRAVYQAGYCWAQATTPSPDLPCPSEWGWKRKEPCSWEANWTSLPEATVACRELLRCGCKKGCKKNCKCSKAALQCTALCQCGGQCTEN